MLSQWTRPISNRRNP